MSKSEYGYDFDNVLTKWNLPGLRLVEVIRVPEQGAREILLSNVTMNVKGTVRNFSLEHIGLGVYKVRLTAQSKQGNYII